MHALPFRYNIFLPFSPFANAIRFLVLVGPVSVKEETKLDELTIMVCTLVRDFKEVM